MTDILEIRPVSLKQAQAFVDAHHRHNKAPRGHKFSVGVFAGIELAGVATADRPVARALDDGLTLEVNRTCTLGAPNANSMLYGAVRRAAWGMGYRRLITYTQADEPGTSLRAAGFRRAKELAPRGSWADHSRSLSHLREPVGNGGTARVRWEVDR